MALPHTAALVSLWWGVKKPAAPSGISPSFMLLWEIGSRYKFYDTLSGTQSHARRQRRNAAGADPSTSAIVNTPWQHGRRSQDEVDSNPKRRNWLVQSH